MRHLTAVIALSILCLAACSSPTAETAAPAPTPTATPGGAIILSFEASPAEASPGDTVTLRWQTRGGFGGTVVKALPDGTNGAILSDLPPSGETQVTLSDGDANYADFNLSLDTGGDPLAASARVTVLCQRTWFFDGGPVDTCPGWPAGQNAGQGAVQLFEHGQIIFSGGDGWAIALYDDGRQPGWARLYPDWKPGDPEPALTPPAGLFQPIDQVGAVWRAEVIPGQPPRARLGWATAPQTTLPTNYQCDSSAFYYPDPASAPCFVSGPGGADIRLWAEPGGGALRWEPLPHP